MPGTDGDPSPQQASAAAAAAAVEQQLLAHEEAQQEVPPRPFEPLFTLLTNSTTNATVHPRVHYIFADDDPAALPVSTASDPSHRALIVDLAAAPSEQPGRWSVAWASSLSPDFAVTSSDISLQQNEGDDGGLMLRLEGVEREPVEMTGGGSSSSSSLPNSQGSGGGALVGKEDVEALTEDFRRRMAVLKKVVGQGERRREVLGRQHEGEQEEGEEAVVDARDDRGDEEAKKKEVGTVEEADRGDIEDG